MKDKDDDESDYKQSVRKNNDTHRNSIATVLVSSDTFFFGNFLQLAQTIHSGGVVDMVKWGKPIVRVNRLDGRCVFVEVCVFLFVFFFFTAASIIITR